jgi:adenine-specific DNA-methyltransferase
MDAALRVARGQFWTSPAVARFMASRLPGDRSAKVMEAGSGSGVFLRALRDAGFTSVTGFEIDGERAAACAAEFPGYTVRSGDFLDTAPDGRFALSVGNPPYVAWGNMDAGTRARLSSGPFWPALADGKWDLLYAFLVWEAEHLADGGEMHLVIPVNFFASTHAASLRRYLAERGNVLSVVSFGEWSPFSDAAPNTVIFRFRRQDPDPGQPVAVVEWLRSTGDQDRFLADAGAALDRLAADPLAEESGNGWRAYTQPAMPADDRWSLAPRSERDAAAVIAAACPSRLGDVAQVGVGYFTGCNDAYRLDDADVAAMPAGERCGAASLVKAASCRRWSIGVQARLLRRDDIADEADLRQTAPWSFARLDARRSALSARYGASASAWWHWSAARNEPLFSIPSRRPRIFVPSMDRAPRARYSLGPADAVPAGDVLGIVLRDGVPDAPEYALAWLNSSHMEAWWRVFGSSTGHRRLFYQRVVEGLPYLPGGADRAAHDAVVSLVRAGLRGDLPIPDMERQADDILAGILLTARTAACDG